MKNLISILILSGAMSAFSRPVMASNYLNGKQSAKAAAAQALVLQSLEQDMTSKLGNIEVELTLGNSAKALRMAKDVLDDVRAKTGIDPKSKIEDSFRVNISFGKSVSSFMDLSKDQQRVVIETISNYHGGLYLDIMNLSKRTSLLYTRAFQTELEKQGGLNQTDKKKILKDLVRASIIPMMVEDKLKNKIVAFDEDVANEDHIYLFNRELKMHVLSNSVLEISEAEFDNEVLNMKMELDAKRTPLYIVSSKVRECLKRARQMDNSFDKGVAGVMCMEDYAAFYPSAEECGKMAKSLNAFFTYEERMLEICIEAQVQRQNKY